MFRFKLFPAVFCILIFFSGCSQESMHSEEFLLMDTFVRIEIRSALPEGAKKRVVQRVIARMKKLDRKFNYFSDNSELAMVNRMGKGNRLLLSGEMFKVLKAAQVLHRRTRGAFDVAMGTGRWRLDSRKKAFHFKDAGVKLNLGGIAKGFIVDEGIRVLRELGIDNACINAGGDIFCMGGGTRRKGWKIGIRDPRRPEKIVEILVIRDKGVATSGGYERFSGSAGRRVSHIIDPKTGEPIKDIFKSVTVVARDAMTADGFATAFYTMDPQMAVFFAERLRDIDCIVVDEKGLVYASSGIPKQS